MKLIVRRVALLVSGPIISFYQSQRCLGELLIRHCLETAFKDLGIYLETIRSDEQFASINMEKFDIIIVDPWTWAGKG
jgi:23S rRNA G2069 N7-methylase RlmK/C1962 C5-methylase RlmI